MDRRFLPLEIIFLILLRLPAKFVIQCKCVCKSWLKLIESSDFAKDHLSMSVPGFIVYGGHEIRLFDYVNELALEHDPNRHYNLVLEFSKTAIGISFDRYVDIEGSINGLLLLSCIDPSTLFICNPITREYIKLPSIKDHVFRTIGFGVTLMSCTYKVIMIIQDGTTEVTSSECWVYKLGSKDWKEIATPCPIYYYRNLKSAFFNGKLHWLVHDLTKGYLISCFDLETEVFSAFPSPPALGKPSYRSGPVVFENSLCISEITAKLVDNEIVIWMMKEYGNEKSWTKQFVFVASYVLYGSHQVICPLKLFEDGNMLLVWGDAFFFYYSKKTNTTQGLYLSRPCAVSPHVPSFISLGSLGIENVRKFKLVSDHELLFASY